MVLEKDLPKSPSDQLFCLEKCFFRLKIILHIHIHIICMCNVCIYIMVRDGVKGLFLNSTATFCFYLRAFFSSSCAIGKTGRSSSIVCIVFVTIFFFFFEFFFFFLSLIVTTKNENFEPERLFKNY